MQSKGARFYFFYNRNTLCDKCGIRARLRLHRLARGFASLSTEKKPTTQQQHCFHRGIVAADNNDAEQPVHPRSLVSVIRKKQYTNLLNA